MKKTLSYLALCFVAATVAGCQTEDADPFGGTASVSYTHLTLPTKLEV